MLTSALRLRLAAALVVVATALTTRAEARAAAFYCDFCYQGNSCGLTQPGWVGECQSRSCSGDTYACWYPTGDACPSGYVYVDCDYHES
jgi:hypothetical protein